MITPFVYQDNSTWDQITTHATNLAPEISHATPQSLAHQRQSKIVLSLTHPVLCSEGIKPALKTCERGNATHPTIAVLSHQDQHSQDTR